MYDFTTLQKIYKKLFVKKFITLTLILSNIYKNTAMLFTKKVWITFLIFILRKVEIF